MTASDEIDEIVRALGDWRGERLEQVRSLIRGADPQVVEEIKWRKPSNPRGVPTWSADGIICTGESYRDKLKLTFPKGASVHDPTGIFNASLTGVRRAVDIGQEAAIDPEAFTALIRAAIAANRS